MKQNQSFATHFYSQKQNINMLLQLMKDLIHITHELKIAVYKIIDIPIEDISFKVRNDESSILTNIKSIYFDISRIQSIISKSKSKSQIHQYFKKQINIPAKQSLKHYPLIMNKQMVFHSQIDQENSLVKNMYKDLNETIKYPGKNKNKSSKTEYFNKNQLKIRIKNQQNYIQPKFSNFQQKIIKISKKLDIENMPLNSINFEHNIDEIKRPTLNINMKDLKDQELRSSANSNQIISKIRKNRKQLLQYVRQKQKRCLNYIHNIFQSSSAIPSKSSIQLNPKSKQNINLIFQNQRKMLKNKLAIQLQQI